MNYNNKTDDWLKYERGVKYNNSIKPNYYDTVNTNIAFYNGDQWRNVNSNGMPTPVFNIIKRVITFFVSSITSSKVAIKLSPLAYSEQQQDPEMQFHKTAADIATSEIDNLFEKFKMDNRIRDACFDMAIMGDVAAHIYFDADAKPYGGMLGDVEGEINFELVDGTNVMLGNANNPTISTKIQPYVVISGRDMVENLRDEAIKFKSKEDHLVISDSNTQNQAGDMAGVEVEIDGDEYGKALYIIVYRYDKKTGTIKVSKCTETAYMYKDIDTGLSNYPVAWLNWEKQKNQYHGRAISTGIISNQIFINKMFAMVMYHLMMSAFPKVVFDKNKISEWDNSIGSSIAAELTMPGDSVRNIAAYMEPGNMSNQITQVIDLAIQYTKETLGINDAMMGQVNPEQASGVAIASTVRQSFIPLENPKANLYEWVEDIGRILVDMMGTYYGQRPIVVSKDGQKSIETFDFTVFKNLWLSVRADVGPSTYWSEIAKVEMLNNLLTMKDPMFQLIDYLESLPDDYKAQDLIDRIKEKQKMLEDQQTDVQQQAYEQMAQFVGSLPEEEQARLEQLRQSNPEEYEQTVAQMMQQ